MIQLVTFALAVLGAILGVINTWHTIDKNRVKLLVRPGHAIPIGNVDDTINLCIEVINLSSFGVTIDEVGILYKGTKKRGVIINPITFDGLPWPRRLEPRSSVKIYTTAPNESNPQLKCVYASTSCGTIQKGNSPAFRQLARQVSQVNPH